MAHITELISGTKYQAKVLKSKRLTPENTDEIREILIEIQQPEFDIRTDQSFGVLINSAGAFGNQVHHRLYSVADLPKRVKGKMRIALLVKRCFYVDEFSGEKYDGTASNYLCDRQVGNEITITGPFDLPFAVPEDRSSNIILIGMGTGIAPFRAYIKHIYKNVKDWKGKIRLFYGAKSGLELLYLNDKNGDLTNYYDEETFEAFYALSPRPAWSDPIALETTIEQRSEEILEMLSSTNTYVYVAGYEKVSDKLDKALSNILGSKEKWETRKAELKAGKRWAEIIY
jgi:ferredoxin--NADP+ reductase